MIKYNWPVKTDSNEIDFNDIEAKIGFELPEDYRHFLGKYIGHGMAMGKEFLALWDRNDLVLLNEGYRILENLPGTIGIGSNGGGELIAIEKLENEPIRIVLTPVIDLDRQYHIEIGKSFFDFLLRLDKGEEWFKSSEDEKL